MEREISMEGRGLYTKIGESSAILKPFMTL